MELSYADAQAAVSRNPTTTAEAMSISPDRYFTTHIATHTAVPMHSHSGTFKVV